MSDPIDYLFLEDLFIARIKDTVPGLKTVDGLPDLQAVTDEADAAPAAYVIYLGDSTPSGPSNQGGEKKVQLVKQYWAVVLTVYTADPNGRGSAARKEAGPLLGKIINSLTGWEPASGVSKLTRAPKQAPAQYSNSLLMFPLIFTTDFVYPRIKTWAPPPN